ncbi:cell envelope integrity protein CreD [Aliamphritea hakodatensis]|uniref:cell envelope integrity protein CreD n=1 Tax=Aliamphritea hakodatensis TaxID=2895352 RepID=UPI0022FDA126|nr:cell envelope integrity protein CreD [Aliamphritea hakodatensis]
MTKRLAQKILALALLGILLWIPLLLEQDVIYERIGYRDQVIRDIATTFTGEQVVTGPMVIIPWSLSYQAKIWDDKTKSYQLTDKKRSGRYLLLPEQLNSEAVVSTSTRQRGIYEVPVYKTRLDMQGRFSNAGLLSHQKQLEEEYQGTLSWGKATLSVMVSDMRGIVDEPSVQWQQQSLNIQPGSQLASHTQGVHGAIPAFSASLTQSVDFSVAMQIRGMERLLLTPVGDYNRISMQSDWQHPSFTGRYLPESYTLTDNGFAADWSTSPFSADLQSVARECLTGNYCLFADYAVGADFIQPVDMYVQAERSIKYGLLFIGVTFIVFFLFEVLKQLQIHPVQYGMVGMALALFYMLLISLSEHISFGLAYLLATLACTGLLGIYLSAVLKSLLRGVSFAAGLSALYGLLFVIISSEDYALLMGSVLIFAILAISMIMTRKVDWYQVGGRSEKPVQAKEKPAG